MPPAPEIAPLSLNQPIFGRDFYANQSQYWNEEASNKYPTKYPTATGNLDNTFGASLDKVKRTLDFFNSVYHRVHLINGVCIRNNNCGRYEIGYGFTKQSFNRALENGNKKILTYLEQRTKLYKTLAENTEGTTFIISPVLEHDLSIKAWRRAADTVRSAWPDVLLSNSPDGGIRVERYLGAWIERHGSNPQADSDIVSLDGADATQINIAAFLKRVRALPHVKIANLWTSGDNCRIGVWQDPRARKNCPSAKTFELMSHLTDPVPAPIPYSGTGCIKIIPFLAPDIWKPLSEVHIKYDSRQELPVTIFKGFQGKDISVDGSTGVEIGRLGYYGTYFDQGFRWYSGYGNGSKASGYELQEGAQASSGSPYAWLRQGGVCKGPLLPGRRQGLMRDK